MASHHPGKPGARLFSIDSPEGRKSLMFLGLALFLLILILDFVIRNLPLGFLYFLPMLLLSSLLDRKWIAVAALVCAALAGLFSYYPLQSAIVLFVTAWVGFTGTGFFVSEVVRNRQKALTHVQEMEKQIRLRRDTEQ